MDSARHIRQSNQPTCYRHVDVQKPGKHLFIIF